MLGVVGTEITIQRRTKGGITGTRVAGALGRIPIYDLIKKREPIWRDWGLRLNDDVLTMPTYIDNLYALAGSVENAIAIVNDAGLHLRSAWNLLLKADSKLVTSSANGTDFEDGQQVGEFTYVAKFSCARTTA